MKIGLLSAMIGLGLAFGAQAGEMRAPLQKGAFTCSAGLDMLFRVSDGGDSGSVADLKGCCSRQGNCAQFLSTTRVEHSKAAPRT